MKVPRLLLAALFSIAVQATVHAKTWNVATSGNDLSGSGSIAAPFATIQKAIDASSNGDTVLVAPGTYSGDGNRDINLRGKRITVQSSGNELNTILDLGRKKGFTATSSETRDTVISGFTIKNGYATSSLDWLGVGIIDIWDPAGLTIKNCIFTQNEVSTGYITTSAAIINKVEADGKVFVDNVLFYNNTCRGGNWAHHYFTHIVGMSGSEFLAGRRQNYDTMEIKNCTIAFNKMQPNNFTPGGVAVLATGSIKNSVVWGNDIGTNNNVAVDSTLSYLIYDGTISGLAVDGTNFSVDPGFVDSSQGNFRLKPDSPAKDKGDPNFPKDSDGSRADIGYKYPLENSLKDSDGDGVNDFREGKDGTDPNNAASFDPLSKGLVAFYPFDGSLADESGAAGVAEGFNGFSFDFDPAVGKKVLQIEGKGFASTADGGYIQIKRPQGLGDTGTISFSLFEKGYSHRHGQSWVSFGQELNNRGLLGRAWMSSWEGVEGIYLGPASPSPLNLPAEEYTIETSSEGHSYAPGKIVFKNPRWREYTVVFNKDTYQLFIDGKMVGSISNQESMPSSGDIFINRNWWGGTWAGTSTRLSGSFSEFRIYNRALSAAEVSQLYAKESENPNMVTVQGGRLPQGSELAGQTVGTFQISKFETTWGEWKAVRGWAVANGYTDLANVGAGRGDNFPVTDVSWYDVLKWCNARSEMEGLSPVYKVSGLTYRNGQSLPSVNSAANGYRLPLEKESEWAARGGISSKGYYYSGSNDLDSVAWYMDSGQVQAVGGKLSNELGIHDMSGNIWEWVWDIYEPVPAHRRFRSGCWNPYAGSGSVSFRDGNSPPNYRVYWLGFRLARNSGTPDTTAPAISITSISANARLTSANATFGGTITETGSKPTLQYRLGTTGNWTASTVGGSASPYSFSQLVALKPGPNTVQFQAKDDAGNTSALASINVSYVVASTLTIPALNAADGSVTSGFGGSTSREVGVSYTVTATPASGMVFKEWLKNGVSAGTNATLNFTMQPGLTLTPVFVPDFAKLGGFYNGLIGTGAIGSGSAADMQAFATNNGFIQITSGANGALSGVLKIEGKSHSFTGTMGANKRATITVPRPGKSNATLSLSLVSALPGEISGNVTTSGAPLAFRALRGGYTAGAAKHALAGKRYAIVLPPPSGLAIGYGHATLTVEDNGAAVLSGVLANGQAVNTGARIVDDGAGNWVMPVYVGGSGIFTGEIVIPKTAPASGSEIGGSLEWLKPASNRGLFRQGFLKAVQPLGASHNPTSAGLGGAEFQLSLDPAKRILPAEVVQNGSWPNGAAPVLATPVKSGLTITFNSLGGRFEGRFNRTAAGATVPTPFQGTLFSRPISIPGGATLRGAGFFTSGNASTAIEITSNVTVTPSANMITVQGGTLPTGSGLAGQTVATFQIGKYEVTWGEWKAVRDWAVANGYSDLVDTGSSDGIPPGRGKGEKNPVTTVSWYDAVKWCNARSEMENIVPVYRNSNGSIYKTSEGEPITLNSANGYRLPTETEWEWAARGGILSQGYVYSGGNDLNSVAVGYGGDQPVGTKTGNELGIHDMSGNVSEWVWDSVDPPSGSPYKIYRTYRGGDSFQSPNLEICKVAFRATGGTLPFNRPGNFGIRLARNAGN